MMNEKPFKEAKKIIDEFDNFVEDKKKQIDKKVVRELL